MHGSWVLVILVFAEAAVGEATDTGFDGCFQ